MNWGIELWDQYENINNHTQKGIEFLDKFGSFVKERCAIENEYASKLRRLVKNHQLKRKDEDFQQFTYTEAFMMMLKEITDLAGQHEVIAENMMDAIVKQIGILVKEMKEERKRILNEGTKHQQTLVSSLTQLDKAKKAYEKAFKEAEKAHENYKRVDADLNLSRADVEKAKMCSNLKSQMCEESKSEYAKHLQSTNATQHQHYSELMPMVFQRFQAMEERRITCIKDFIKGSAVIQQNVTPIINRCLEGMIGASDSIDAQKDCDLVVEKYQSGNEHPTDIPFEDLNNPRPASEQPPHKTNLHHSNSMIKSDTYKGTISTRFKKRGVLTAFFGSNKTSIDDVKDDYAELPPNQRRKRIQGEIDKLKAEINQETNVRDGLLKMKQVYEQNHALGDPMSIQGQLQENSRKMEELQAKLRQAENLLDQFNGTNNKHHAYERSPSRVRNSKNNSLSEDSLSRSASDSSVSQKQDTSTPLHDSDDGHVNSHDENNDNYEQINSSSVSRTSEIIKNDQHSSSNEDGSTTTPSNPQSLRNGATDEIEGNSLSHPGVEFIDEDGDGCDFENEMLPALGKAWALFAFEASSEGSIPMEENEEFEVVELDQGDGWTRVRRLTDKEEGFVPTSWLRLEIYND